MWCRAGCWPRPHHLLVFRDSVLFGIISTSSDEQSLARAKIWRASRVSVRSICGIPPGRVGLERCRRCRAAIRTPPTDDLDTGARRELCVFSGNSGAVAFEIIAVADHVADAERERRQQYHWMVRRLIGIERLNIAGYTEILAISATFVHRNLHRRGGPYPSCNSWAGGSAQAGVADFSVIFARNCTMRSRRPDETADCQPVTFRLLPSACWANQILPSARRCFRSIPPAG